MFGTNSNDLSAVAITPAALALSGASAMTSATTARPLFDITLAQNVRLCAALAFNALLVLCLTLALACGLTETRLGA